MNEYQNIWNKLLTILKEELDETTYKDCFSNSTEVYKFENNYIYVKTPTVLVSYRIQQFYLPKIKELLPMVTDLNVGFKFVDEKTVNETESNKPSASGLIVEPDGLEKITRTIPSIYNFENFVAGESNRYAWIMAMNVAKDGPKVCNPLYIFGDVGLGKTHLMTAIGNYVLDNNINAKVVYIGAQKFAEDYFLATSSRGSDEKIKDFYNKYRNIDFLLIDDIQLLEGKTATQEEFFKVFEDLVNKNKQIVITSDRPVTELKNIMQRLKSRFSWGVVAEIKSPDEALRFDILKRKLSFLITDPNDVPDAVLHTLARLFDTNIRDMEGALRTFVNYCVCMNCPFIEENLFTALEKVIPQKKGGEDASKTIINLAKQEICDYYKITIKEIESDSRKKNIAYARQMLMYILRTDYNISLQLIGDNLGNRDHTTISHGIDKIAEMIKSEDLTKQDYAKISKKIADSK